MQIRIFENITIKVEPRWERSYYVHSAQFCTFKYFLQIFYKCKFLIDA